MPAACPLRSPPPGCATAWCSRIRAISSCQAANLITDEVELNVEANLFDGMVLLSTCDSIVPGHLMACARLDIPAVVVTGGYMPHCFWRGEDIGLVKVSSTVGKVMEGTYAKEDFEDMMECARTWAAARAAA